MKLETTDEHEADDQQREAEDREARRLERRASIRQLLAEKQLLQQRADELHAEVSATESRLDSLAANHERDMQPIQAKLLACNGRITSALAQRHEPAVKDVAERRKLLDEIDQANRQLQSDLSTEKALLAGKRRERDAAFQLVTGHRAHEGLLSHPDVANPTLAAEAFVARSAMQWAASRLQIAQAKRRHVAESLRTAPERFAADEIPALTRRLAHWDHEVEAAQRASVAALAASDAAHQAVIDE